MFGKKNFVFVALMFKVTTAVAQDVAENGQYSLAYYKKTQRIVNGLSKDGIIEYEPSISADGKTMIFPASDGGSSFKLYESRQKNGSWSNPVALDRINSFGDSTDLIAGPSISFDGNILYFSASIGMGSSSDIYISKKTVEGWSTPKSSSTRKSKRR